MTQTPLNVHTFCSDATRRKHLLTLSSLPLSFTSDENGAADIALAGSDDAEIARAIASGPKAIVLDRPAAASAAALQRALDSGIAVLPVLEVAPTLAPCRAIAPLSDAMLVHSCLSSTAPARSGRLEHILALESVVGPLADITMLDDAGDAYWMSGRLANGATRVLWNGQTGALQDRFDLDVIALAQRLEVEVAYAPAAKPASIRLAARNGSQQLRGIFESGLRLFWREVAAEVGGRPGTAVPLSAAVQHLANTQLFKAM